LCREMAMGRTLFFGRLKSLTGKTHQENIRILELERAAELLKQKTPVTEVAVMTGFANSKYFSTIFKKHFGVSPSKYCEQN
ncbi:helix-turn-helix transcriptional regulator, partial [Escherichia coli]|uniref:helix-turn-helix transcriptional regulator n=1 Tax=Escherichia coli TaxID=562 RepID=UPI00390C4DB0